MSETSTAARLYHRPQATSAWQDSDTVPDSRRFRTVPSTPEQENAMMSTSRHAEATQALSRRTWTSLPSSDDEITEFDRDMNDCGAQIMPYCSDFSVGVMNVNVTKNIRRNIDDETIAALLLLVAIRLLKAGWVGLSFLFTSLPRSVRLSNANSLIITDALGFTVTLHCGEVQTYDALATFLIHHFEGKVGEQRVKDERYCIAQAADGSLVNRQNWEAVFERRKSLVMSMLIEQIYNEELHEKCPKCGITDLGTFIDDGWFVCRRCNSRFLPPEEGAAKEEEGGAGEDNEENHFRNVRSVEIKQVTPVSPRVEEVSPTMVPREEMSSPSTVKPSATRDEPDWQLLEWKELSKANLSATEWKELEKRKSWKSWKFGLRSSSSDPPKDRHPASAYGMRGASRNAQIPHFEAPRFQELND